MFKCSLKNINCNPVYTEKKKRIQDSYKQETLKSLTKEIKIKTKMKTRGKAMGQ